MTCELCQERPAVTKLDMASPDDGLLKIRVCAECADCPEEYYDQY